MVTDVKHLLKRLGKAIGRSQGLRRAACWLLAQYIRLVWATGRWTVEGGAAARARFAAGQPFILCFWHGRLLMMPYCWPRDRAINMLISAHRDGQLIASTVAHFGIATVAGSTTHGGGAALRAMLKALKAGESIGITPDGPRGPRMRVGGGIIDIARLAGVPVIPATFSATRARIIGSWDRFLLALPFARGAILWGEPLAVARDADPAACAAARQALEDSLNALCAEADRRCGRTPILPADPAAPAAVAAPAPTAPASSTPAPAA
ncbi:MAG: lysophospholipid acyltransferase family protein [Alphaproteobacteria bacterium]|nr:lysophospholipid acyltransferase family protein [Alphaproteobacteria bacterium]